MSHLDQIFTSAKGQPAQFAKDYLSYLSSLFERLDDQAISDFINLCLEMRESGQTIFFIGNGGSAATASHFANDFAIGTRCPEKPICAVSLTDNNAVMTAIANDFGYDKLFVKQLEVQMKKGDALVAISASGNSPNIIEAVKFSKSLGNKVVGLTGFDGGELKSMSDISIHVQCSKGEYGPVEDIHMVVDHLMGSYLNRMILQESK